MNKFDPSHLKQLYIPKSGSHKGQNGKVLLIGGSKLFHAASLWPLTVMSRLCDMVFYASVPENNELVQNAKQEFRNGIVIPRDQLEKYIEEADAILIGPGMPRPEGKEEGDDDTKELTERLLKAYPYKKWVIDGGSLQTIDPKVLLTLTQMPILTPHQGEYGKLTAHISSVSSSEEFARKFKSVVLLKGEVDSVSSPTKSVHIPGGNAGMTKGGTGDILAGLVTALYAKNDDAFLVACAASYINKKAGESLEKTMGIYFNASDLVLEIPKVMKTLT